MKVKDHLQLETQSTKTSMEPNEETAYTFDLNLDFLDNPTISATNSNKNPIHYENNSTYDIESLATRIANINDMTLQLKAIKDENINLQKQMQELNDSAMSIRSMYEEEQSEKFKYHKLYEELNEKHIQLESQLTNKSLHFEQIQSRLELEAEDKKPIPYNDLALRYQRLAIQLEENKQLPSKEKIIVQQIKEYTDSKKLAPLGVLWKKKNHNSKSKSRDLSIQCDFKVESKTQETQCSLDGCVTLKETCTQSTQSTWSTTTRGTNTPNLSNPKKEMKSQGTQYISSTTTRGTSTSAFIKTQSVGTMYPEPSPPVSIDDIFKEMIYDVAPLSPMATTPPQVATEMKEEKVEMKSIGTCTELKNVRKLIDYVAVNIKNSDSRPPSRNNININNLYDRVKNEIPLMGMPMLNPFAGLGGIGVTTTMHNNVVELWNMLGQTIFGLMQLQQQQTAGTAAPLHQFNSIHMNTVNDRLRNFRGRSRPPCEQLRNCDSQVNFNSFDTQEYSREYSTTTATRSTATSPIVPTELLNNNQYSSSSLFVPVASSHNQPKDIEKITLNSNFSQSEVSSSKKSSKIDEILQLFPEYSDSIKKRRAIKKLLKEANKIKSLKSNKKRNSNSTSSTTSVSTINSVTGINRPSFNLIQPTTSIETKIHLSNNWKTEIFGDSDSDSSLDNVTMDGQFEMEAKQIMTPTSPPEQINWPSLERNKIHIKTPKDEEFLGFDEEANFSSSSSNKQHLQLKHKYPIKDSNQIKIEQPKKEPQPSSKRKRRTKKSLASSVTNKICKIDEVLPEQPIQPINEFKSPVKLLPLNKTKTASINHLPATTTSASVKKPLRSLSLNKNKNIKSEEVIVEPSQKDPVFVKPSWMNKSQHFEEEEEKDLSIQVASNNSRPMVMKVEKPPDSIFQNIKTCFTNQRSVSDVKPFTGPIIPNGEIVVENGFCSNQPSKEDATLSCFIQNEHPTNDFNNLKCPINYVEPEKPQELNSKSTITILKEELISEPKDFKLPIVSPMEEDNSLFDLENMPICFLDDDQNIVENFEEETILKRNQERESEKPEIQKIEETIIDNQVELVSTKSHSSSQVPLPNDFQLNTPVIIEHNNVKTHTTESLKPTTGGDVKPIVNTQRSYLVLSHQPLLNSDKKSLNTFTTDTELKKETTNDATSFYIHEKGKHKSSNDNFSICKPSNEVPVNSFVFQSPNEKTFSDFQNKRRTTSSSSSSTSESDQNALDLSAILKTPQKNQPPSLEFKTPEMANSFITKAMTNSTEKLVDDFIENDENPSGKFQTFLDKILDDVAPPTSPISAFASSEKQSPSEAGSSCDEDNNSSTPKKYNKRKAPPSAAIAVKRSERIKAKQMESQITPPSHYLCAMTVGPQVEIGKYTLKKTEQTRVQNVDDVIEQTAETQKKFNIVSMGFFRETIDEDEIGELVIDEEDDEKPICEPIRRCSIEESLKIEKSCSYDNDEVIKKQQMTSVLNLESNEKDVNLENLNSSSSSEAQEISPCSYQSPASPPPSDKAPNESYSIREFFDSSSHFKTKTNRKQITIVSHMISKYSEQQHTIISKEQQFDENLLKEIQHFIKVFLNGKCHVMDTLKFVESIATLTSDEKIISKAIVNVLKNAPRPETEVDGPIPTTYLSQTHRKLLSIMEPLSHNYPKIRVSLQSAIERTLFTFAKEIFLVEVLLNLTQFYLHIIENSMPGITNPARLFICKCLYFFNQKAIPMIYHTLCVYPTVLPQKIDSTYDRSDILISTIQSILMSTYFDPEKCDLMTRQILAKLRMFYNYESFKPPRDEVIENIIAKIRAGRLKNVSYALSLICKRMEQSQTEKFILNERLLPLANEFYHSLNSSNTDNDEKIACVLECISFIIKPFNLSTDISQYVCLFSRFLNAAAQSKIVQEASVAAILRTARFGYVQCFNAIYNFKPTYQLSDNIMLMLRSFIYKKGKAFLLALEKQAQELVAT